MFGKYLKFGIVIILSLLSFSAFAQQNSPPTTGAELEKDAQTEYQKRLTETETKNRQIIENNLKVQTALTEGINAFRNKEYELAIEKFDEAIRLEPDYWGTSPVLLTNKAMVLRIVGVKKYNEAARNYWSASSEANPYFNDAVNSLNRALQIFADTPIEIAEANRSSFDQYKFNTIKELAECYRLLSLTDQTRTDEAIKAFEDYISIEADELKREIAVKELTKLRAKK